MISKFTPYEFECELYKHNNKLTIIGDYKSTHKKLFVKDEDDIIYYISPKELLKIKHPTIRTAINKTKAFNIKLSKILHGYKLIEYTVGSVKSLVVDELGIKYLVKPESLLTGSKPTLITAIDKNDAFKKLAKCIHGEKYNYDLVNYIGNKVDVFIICKKCNTTFKQRPNNHLCGQGCPNCVKSRGWSKKEWCKHSKDKQCTFYIIKCYNNEEEFIKFGITTKTIKHRFFYKKYMPYNYDIIYNVNGSPEDVWDMEKKFDKEFKKYKYTPKFYFKGYTECYNINVQKFFET
jgi:hypothetical protein